MKNALETRMTLMLAVCLATGASCAESDDDGGSLQGSATLPDCMDPPAFQIDGTRWIIDGPVTITSDGCPDAAAGDALLSCLLVWDFRQDGNDLTIVSDGEYTLRGRMCGDTVHVTGGWWLPFPDDQDQCNFADEDGEEVVIEEGGNTLTIAPFPGTDQFMMTGTLSIRGADDAGCTGEMTVDLRSIPQQTAEQEADVPTQGQVLLVGDLAGDPELVQDPRAGVLLRSLDGGLDEWLPLAAFMTDGPPVFEVEPGMYGASLVVGDGLAPSELEKIVEVNAGGVESLSLKELQRARR